MSEELDRNYLYAVICNEDGEGLAAVNGLPVIGLDRENIELGFNFLIEKVPNKKLQFVKYKLEEVICEH